MLHVVKVSRFLMWFHPKVVLTIYKDINHGYNISVTFRKKQIQILNYVIKLHQFIHTWQRGEVLETSRKHQHLVHTYIQKKTFSIIQWSFDLIQCIYFFQISQHLIHLSCILQPPRWREHLVREKRGLSGWRSWQGEDYDKDKGWRVMIVKIKKSVM